MSTTNSIMTEPPEPEFDPPIHTENIDAIICPDCGYEHTEECVFAEPYEDHAMVEKQCHRCQTWLLVERVKAGVFATSIVDE